MLLCLYKIYGTFLWFLCPRDSLIHFRPSAWCINLPILRFHINNIGLACHTTYMKQALHFKKRFIWSKHSCVIQLKTNNIWALLQIIPNITSAANIFFQIKLSNYVNDRVREFLCLCACCAGHAKVELPFFLVPRNDRQILKISSFLTDIHRSRFRTTYGRLLSTFIK